MARRRRRVTPEDLDRLRHNGKQGQTLPDAIPGLEWLKMGQQIYLRVRPMKQGKRYPKQWRVMTAPEGSLIAREKDLPVARVAREHLDELRLKAQAHINAVKSGATENGLPVAPTAPTVAELADRWLSGPGSRSKPKTQDGNRSLVERFIRPRIGHLCVNAVKRIDVEELHSFVGNTSPERDGTPVLANRLLSLLSTMFNWAIEHEWREGNPTKGIARFAEHERERWLTDAELAGLGEVLERHASEPAAQAIKLLALTGARRSEVLGAKWSEFSGLDGDDPKWTIPAIRTKKDKSVVRQLDPVTVELLRSLPRTEGVPYLFPSAVKPGEHLKSLRRPWKRFKKEAGIIDGPDNEPAVIHTLRHTVASHIVSDGGELLIASRQLGHSSLKTTQRYAKLAPGKLRDTMTAFGKKLGA